MVRNSKWSEVIDLNSQLKGEVAILICVATHLLEIREKFEEVIKLSKELNEQSINVDDINDIVKQLRVDDIIEGKTLHVSTLNIVRQYDRLLRIALSNKYLTTINIEVPKLEDFIKNLKK